MVERLVSDLGTRDCKLAAWRTPGSHHICYRFYACGGWLPVEVVRIRESERHLSVREIAGRDWDLAALSVREIADRRGWNLAA